MKLVVDYNNLVIVGLWNRHIFYPEWVGQYRILTVNCVFARA